MFRLLNRQATVTVVITAQVVRTVQNNSLRNLAIMLQLEL